MDEQVEALRVLKKARSVLAERLAKRLLAEEDDVLDDANGQSYMDEIEAVFQQIGQRLQRINEMIDDLTVARDAAPRRIPVPALPAPRARTSHMAPATLQTVTLQTIAARVQAGRLNEAANYLSALFGINQEQGTRCAEHFAGVMSQQPELLWETMRLRGAVRDCRYNHVFALLRNGFGLTTNESLLVLRNLATRFGAGARDRD